MSARRQDLAAPGLTMKRNATLNLKGLDPEVLDAARDVARRAGVPVETWIAAVVEAEEKPPSRRKRRVAQPDETSSAWPHPARTSAPAQSDAKSPVASAAEFLRDPAADASAEPVGAVNSAGSHQYDPLAEVPMQAGTTDPFAASITKMLERLDAIDGKIDEAHRAAQDSANTKVAGTEAKLPTVLDQGLPPVTEMSDRLATIERRMTELGEQLAQPRPLGRRGRPVAVEMKDAIGEIRQRQRELEEREAVPGAVAALQQNVAAGMAAAFQSPAPLAVDALQAETSRLRECIDGLATSQDVKALEQAMLSLTTDVQQARKPSDLAGIVEPVERIEVQVSRLADDVAENVHARVAAEVERLASKLERVLSAAPADREAAGGLFGEIEEIRRLIAALAGPERIQGLANGVQALSAQIAKLQGNAEQDAVRVAELRPLLEEIRTDLKAPKANGIEQQIRAMGVKLDALHDRTPAEGSGSDAIIDRLDALSDKVDRVAVSPVGDLIGRLEDLGETLQRPALAGDGLTSIQAMLHDLVDKVDRVGGNGQSHAGEGLDALEKQILALSQRIDTRGADPAIASLERSMNDLLAQVSPGQVTASTAKGGDREEIGILRAGLADLRTQQAASEQRMQATLNGVHTALDRLATHFSGSTQVVPPQAQDRASSRVAAETVSTAPRSPAAGRRPEMPRAPSAAPETSAEWSRAKDEILEPGSVRPQRSRFEPVADQIEPDAASPSTGEIKSNFIAAARRAALAAQAESAETAPKSRLRDGLGGSRPSASDASSATDAQPVPTRAAQMRAGLDKRRKRLLLSLAAVVLALGTYQGIRVFTAAEEPKTVENAAASTSENASKGGSPDAEGISPAAEAATAMSPEKPAVEQAARPDPQTTQSISKASEPAAGPNALPSAATDPAPSGTKPSQPTGRKAVPRVAEMGSLSGEFGGVPSALATLKAAALEGDGASIYELAARSAEGRGLTRDLALASKLFEKLATAGYAPAQYKLASHYEKGLGLTRDVDQAKLWYGRAAELGNVRSMHNLAVIFAENPSATGKPDFATAAQWFRRGAEHGVRDSQYNLAVLCARGLGVPQDLVQSYVWFAAAAAQGDDDAGKKRDDVAGKLAAKDLDTARGLATAFKAKAADPAANEAPVAKASAAVTLLGAPTPAVALAPRRI